MASNKKRRKQARAAKKANRPEGIPFRHPDGDRRHRGHACEDAIRNKRLMQQFEVALPIPDDKPKT
jgi:hypothetical protein